ncbi:pachytene checkpoint protein 2 [Populus alba x Populus x berolinensis]|nr:pachytene checkpoint protein 2 [Populus alba x Populus x berolinensis]
MTTSPSPMDITIQNPIETTAMSHDLSDGNGVALPSSSPSPILTHRKFLVSVEVCLKPSSTARVEDVRLAVERMLEKRSLSYVDGPIPVPIDDQFLFENVQRICVCDTDEWVTNHDILLFWQVKPVVHVFQGIKIGEHQTVKAVQGRKNENLIRYLHISFSLCNDPLVSLNFKRYFVELLSEEGPCEELGGDGQLSSFNDWILPAKEFDGMWESLIYEFGLKQRLLRYAASALFFTEKGVDPFLVSWNRLILLHGPPGTGKTSLCKALAQKLSIRFNCRYPQCQLIEVNAHSLFSKWFSESGKLVAKLFQKIQEMIEEENNLVFVLIGEICDDIIFGYAADEVESLAAARKAALSGSEPSDSIRVLYLSTPKLMPDFLKQVA